MAEQKSTQAPEDNPQPAAASKAATPQAGKTELTKIDAVKQALDKLGPEATPTAIQAYLQDELGIPIGRDHASTAKRVVLSRAAGKKKKSKGKKAAAKKEPARKEPKPQVQPSAASASPAKGGKGSLGLEDIQAVKSLVDRLGAAELQTLIRVLSK